MEIEQLEALALSDDRDAALAGLVPGTEDHRYWTAIRHQHRGELDPVDQLLDEWRIRHGDTARRRRIERRQLVLRADQDLAAHAAALAEALSVPLDHAREVEHAASWPTALDEALLEPGAVLRTGLRRDRALGGVTDQALPLLLAGAGGELSAARRRALLERLQRGGLPGLIDALVADRAEHPGEQLGALPVHRLLTADELDELAARAPELRTSEAWVIARIQRMRPPGHVDPTRDVDARAAFLDAVWERISTLPAAFGSLKVHVLYHRLACDRERGVVDRERVLRYLALPRDAGYVPRPDDDRPLADLRRRFDAATGLPHVGDDEPLIRALLGELLRTEDSTAFAPFVDSAWLERLLAQTRLLAGDDDAERYARVLGPAATTALRDRVDIELLPSTPRHFGEHAEPFLDVALKNCWPLRVRTYRIQVEAAGGDVPSDIDLDGLAPRVEELREPGLPPMRRARERIALPGCDRPGTWVVELIGNGRASRAVIRKGTLHALPRRTAAGLAVTVVGEDGAPRPSATIRMGERELVPRSDGAIPVPFATGGSGARQVLLCDGDLVVGAALSLPAERYALSASVLLDRQSLVAGRAAIAALRVDLTVDRAPVSLSLLEQTWVEVTTLDRLGVPVRRRRPVTLTDHREIEVRIAVPEHPTSLSIAVGGRVRVVSEQRHVDLRHECAVAVGTIDEQPVTAAVYLVRSTDGFALRVLGKGGEPRPGRALTVHLEHELLTRPVEASLATDADGEVRLGALPGVVGLRVQLPGETAVEQHFDLRPPRPSSGEVTVLEGEPAALPHPGTGWQLVELRAGVPAVDRSELATPDGAMLRVLAPAGTYELRGDEGLEGRFVVLPAAARMAEGWARSPGLIRRCAAPPAHLRSVEVTDDALVVTVANPGPHTRVCVLATPFWPALAWSADLDGPRPPSGAVLARPSACDFVSGRDIGDEYRYVLDRKGLPARPGTLLPKPGLILNPFALRTTHTATRDAREGQGWDEAEQVAYGAAGAAAELEEAYHSTAMSDTIAADAAFAAYDFLAGPPRGIVDQVPDAEGRVVVPRAGLAGVVRVICVDPHGSTVETAPLPPSPVPLRDRRLPRALPAERHLREVRELRVASPDHPLPFDGRAARFEVVGTVGALYQALCALSGDADLASWSFLARWHELDRDERLAIYDEYACHELALFVHGKDRALFDEAIRPYLAGKLHPTFVDRYLLGEDLTGWLRPAALARLDAIERALLARALAPDAPARAALVRTLADAVEIQPTGPARAIDDRLVEILLAGGSAGDDEPEPPEEPAPAPPPAPKGARRAKRAVSRSAPAKAALLGSVGGGGDDDLDLEDRAEMAPLYRGVDKTREWAEHNWWHRRTGDPGVPVARLWRDLAAHHRGPFLPASLADAGHGFAAAVVALAVTDLPFEAPPITIDEPSSTERVVRPGAPVLVAVADLAAVDGEPSGEALLGQATYRGDDRWEWDGAERREKPVGGELVAGVRYEAEVVVSNPTSRSQILDVLVQIPAGAMPTGGSTPTRTHRLRLAAHATGTVATQYYFPQPGVFEQYGARVTRDAQLVAAGEARTFDIVRVPTTTDHGSWAHVSQHGTLDDVVRFLAARNLDRVDLSRIAWRMADPSAFDRVVTLLGDRLVYDHTLWGYALRHHDRRRASEWLSRHDALLDDVGRLRCGLLDADPLDRGRYQHLEYAPLVNARAHTLGERRQVLNDGLAAQWRALLERMATASEPGPDDWLAAAQALVTMDRSGLAEQLLQHVPDGPAALQQAYLRAWLAVGAGDLATARALASPYAEQPVPRWRKRFAALLAMLDEVETGAPPVAGDDRDARMSELAAQQPALTAAVEGDRLVLDHERVDAVQVRAYPMDVELLFSREPFLAAAGERFLRVEPASTTPVALSGDRTEVPIAELVPAGVRDAVLEVVAGPLRRVVTWLAGDLVVMVASAYGQLSVRRASDRRPLPAAYVKAYARRHDGSVAFFKDGYTDLRGWFDFATLSTDDLDRVSRFALLVLHHEAGACVLEADPPAQ